MRLRSMLSAGLLSLAASVAHAQVDEERLRLMRETIGYTDVIDALDGQDRFDLNVQLAYVRQRESGAIYRERTSPEGGRVRERVAQARRELSQLALGVDVGLYRDLMAFVRMPLTLGDARALRVPDGLNSAQLRERLTDRSASGEDETLFGVPFDAPSRAGVDYLALGGAWAVLNQNRDPWHPNWVLRIEGRRAIGKPLRACQQRASAVTCGSAGRADLDGDGQIDGTMRESGGRGSSQGLSALLLETRFSKRYRYVEPYAGIGFMIAWPASGRRAEFATDRDADGRLRQGRPGPEITATLGAALISWEDRGSFQRVALDLRLEATHVATGHAQSALFDALGTSGHADLTRAHYTGAGCADPASAACGGRAVAFRGTTQVASHLRYGGQLGVEVQAARYVRFAVGASLRWVTAHALTGQSRCSGAVASGAPDPAAGCARGQPDPGRRPIIDAPGQRFVIAGELLLGAYAQATAMF